MRTTVLHAQRRERPDHSQADHASGRDAEREGADQCPVCAQGRRGLRAGGESACVPWVYWRCRMMGSEGSCQVNTITVQFLD